MIGLIGFDHQRASLELRGRLTFSGERLTDALQALRRDSVVSEALILSTCNRTEVYVATPDWEMARPRVLALLSMTYSQAHEVPAPIVTRTGLERAKRHGRAAAPAAIDRALTTELADALYVKHEVAAARHLCRVAAGLESMVVGEAQILGQVKDALTAAEAAGTIGEELRAVCVAAIKAGKRVRAETEIGRADVSVAALAVRVAHEALGGLEGKAALVIGAGKTSQLCARLLRAHGIERLVLANRTLAPAEALAAEVAAEAVTLEALAREIGRVQLVISATAAPYPILSAATVAAGLAGSHASLVMIDLAVPADIEAAAGLLSHVSLYTLDTLRMLEAPSLANHNDTTDVATQDDVATQAERILTEVEREYLRGQTLRKMVPGIAALRRHVDRSEQLETARALERLAHLSAADRAVVERLGQRLVDKMFHHLVSRIRSLAEYDEVPPQITMQVLERLFADPDAPGEKR